MISLIPGRHTPRRCRSLAGFSLAVVLVILFGACGRADEHTASVQPGGGNPDAAAPLPALPPNAERHADRYGEDGCLLIGPDESNCGAGARAVDLGELGQGEESWRSLAGFVGPRFTTELGAGQLVVLDDTVLEVTDGGWHATGLVRNEGGTPMLDIVVTAELLDTAGNVMARGEADVSVAPLRPGEPAPFLVEAVVDPAAVADVRWSVVGQPVDVAANRDIEIQTAWTRGFADPRPLDSYLYRDDTRPLASVTFGSLNNVGAVVLDAPRLVVAWIDAEGRVVWSAEAVVMRVGSDADLDAVTTPLVDGDGTITPVDGLDLAPAVDAGDTADYLVVVPADIGVDLDAAAPAMWGWGQ